MDIKSRIVKNQEEIYQRADEITNKILLNIKDISADAETPDDPAESIYLLIHIISLLTAKVCVTLNGYGKTYGIDNFDIIAIREWIGRYTSTYLKLIESDQK